MRQHVLPAIDRLKQQEILHLRDTGRSSAQFQVRVGQGELEYGRIISQLARFRYDRALTVDMRDQTSPALTIAFTAPLASAASTPRLRPSRTACDNAFTGGELIVTSATSPSIERSTTEFMAAMECFLFGERDQRR